MRHSTLYSTLSTRAALAAILARGDGPAGRTAEAVTGAGSVFRGSLGPADGDLFIGPEGVTQALVARGVLCGDRGRPLVHSATALAVAEGSPHRQVESAAALKALLLNARTIGHSVAESGVHFLAIADTLGIGDAVRGKSVLPAPGELVGDLMERGEAELGFQQRSEFIGYRGLRLLTLPAAFRSSIVYRITPFADAADRSGQDAWIGYLASAPLAAAWRAYGLEPVAPAAPGAS